MLASHIDLKKALDSVDFEALWDLLRLLGIFAKVIGLLTGLYSGTKMAVKCVWLGMSRFFPVNPEVRRPSTTSFQHINALGTKQSCGPKLVILE